MALRKCFWTVKLHKTVALVEENICTYKHGIIFAYIFSVAKDEIKRSDHYSVSFDELMKKVTQN